MPGKSGILHYPISHTKTMGVTFPTLVLLAVIASVYADVDLTEDMKSQIGLPSNYRQGNAYCQKYYRKCRSTCHDYFTNMYCWIRKINGKVAYDPTTACVCDTRVEVNKNLKGGGGSTGGGETGGNTGGGETGGNTGGGETGGNTGGGETGGNTGGGETGGNTGGGDGDKKCEFAGFGYHGEQSLADFKKAAYRLHNEYRKAHGVAALTVSPELEKLAEAWANNMASRRSMTHSDDQWKESQLGKKGYVGECIANSGGGISAEVTLQMWYSEMCYPNALSSSAQPYRFNQEKGGVGHVVGHFTQVVWEGTKEIGCAKKGDYSVCHYRPGGNYEGKFTENVKEPAGYNGGQYCQDKCKVFKF